MTEKNRQAILAKIASSIQTHGYHLRIVEGGPSPRFAYTIGLHEKHGFELVLAGGVVFTNAELNSIFSTIIAQLREGKEADSVATSIEGKGTFRLAAVHPTWSSKLLLGALDFLRLPDVRAFQIVPDEDHSTVDVPDMSDPKSPDEQPMWKWVDQDWTLPFSAKAQVITNLDALRGYAITEVMRWEDSEWEMFSGAGPEVPKEDIRTVPLATLLAFDATLQSALDLEIGAGIWREDVGGDWHPWGKRE